MMEDIRSKRQEAFWLGMLDKYEQRNIQLQKQQSNLQHHLEAMECCIPAALMSRINKTGDGNQINMVQFMSQVGRPGVTLAKTASIISDCPCSPCMAIRANVQNECTCNPCLNKPTQDSDECTCDPCLNKQPEDPDECTCDPCLNKQPEDPDECTCDPCLNKQPEDLDECTCDPCLNKQPEDLDECTCDPCLNKQPEDPDECTCDPCPNKQSQDSDECTCNPCLNKQSQDSDECTCNPCEYRDSISTTQSGCQCNPCMAQNSLLNQINLFSLDSSDLLFMSKLQDLVIKERHMKRQIQEMEHRELAYMDTLKKADEMWANMEGNYKRQLSNAQLNGDSLRLKYEKMNEELMDENARIVQELKDTKVELQQCMERLKGPVSRQLENEKWKSQQLQSDIMCCSQKMVEKEYSFMKKLGNKQNELNCTCGKLCQLTAMNEQLKQQLCMIQCKYNEVQQDLINQKLSEAHTLRRLNETLAANEEKRSIEPEDDTLYGIARRLSKTLMAISECQECEKIPSDLTDTVRGIKGLVDIVNTKGGTEEGGKATSGGSKSFKPPGPPPPPSPPSPPCYGPCSGPDPDSGGPPYGGDGGSVSSTDSDEPCPCTDLRLTELSKGQHEGGRGAQITMHSPCNVEAEAEIEPSQETREKLSQKCSRTSGTPPSRGPGRTQSQHVCSRPCNKASSTSNTKQVMIQEPTDICMNSRASKKSPQQEIEILTQVEKEGDVGLEVETEVNLYESMNDGINVTTNVTGSGVLEVITEGPAGIIETTMTYTDSGNIEVTTDLMEYPEDHHRITSSLSASEVERPKPDKKCFCLCPCMTFASEKTIVQKYPAATETIARAALQDTQGKSSHLHPVAKKIVSFASDMEASEAAISGEVGSTVGKTFDVAAVGAAVGAEAVDGEVGATAVSGKVAGIAVSGWVGVTAAGEMFDAVVVSRTVDAIAVGGAVGTEATSASGVAAGGEAAGTGVAEEGDVFPSGEAVPVGSKKHLFEVKFDEGGNSKAELGEKWELSEDDIESENPDFEAAFADIELDIAEAEIKVAKAEAAIAVEVEAAATAEAEAALTAMIEKELAMAEAEKSRYITPDAVETKIQIIQENESIKTAIEGEGDISAISKEVVETLSKANEEVMKVLDQASKEVIEANQDVENTLTTALIEQYPDGIAADFGTPTDSEPPSPFETTGISEVPSSEAPSSMETPGTSKELWYVSETSSPLEVRSEARRITEVSSEASFLGTPGISEVPSGALYFLETPGISEVSSYVSETESLASTEKTHMYSVVGADGESCKDICPAVTKLILEKIATQNGSLVDGIQAHEAAADGAQTICSAESTTEPNTCSVEAAACEASCSAKAVPCPADEFYGDIPVVKAPSCGIEDEGEVPDIEAAGTLGRAEAGDVGAEAGSACTEVEAGTGASCVVTSEAPSLEVAETPSEPKIVAPCVERAEAPGVTETGASEMTTSGDEVVAGTLPEPGESVLSEIQCDTEVAPCATEVTPCATEIALCAKGDANKVRKSMIPIATTSLRTLPKTTGILSSEKLRSRRESNERKSRIPVPIKRGPVSDDFPQIIEKKEEMKEMEGLHPPDCDCVDCLCRPCGSFPADYWTRPHPPDFDSAACLYDPRGHTDGDIVRSPTKKHPLQCECADCLCEVYPDKVGDVPPTEKHSPNCDRAYCICDPCGHVDEKILKVRQEMQADILRANREADYSEQSENIDAKGIFWYDYLVCCEYGGKYEAKPPNNRHSFPPETCKCDKCLYIEGKPPPVEPEASAENDKDVTTHPPDCTCLDCSLLRDVDSDFLPIQEATAEEPHPDDCDCIDCLCEKGIKTEKTDVAKLQEVVKQIKCACYEVEIQAMNTMEPSALNLRTTHTLSGLQLAFQCVQEKCQERDRMISAIIKELQSRSDDREFNDMLHKIAAANRTTMKYDRREIFDSLAGGPDSQPSTLKKTKGKPKFPCSEPDGSCPCSNKHIEKSQSARKIIDTSFKNTLSGLQLALQSAQEKCNEKEHMVAAMLEELELRTNSKVSGDMLLKLATAGNTDIDFDRTVICNMLQYPAQDRCNKPKTAPLRQSCADQAKLKTQKSKGGGDKSKPSVVCKHSNHADTIKQPETSWQPPQLDGTCPCSSQKSKIPSSAPPDGTKRTDQHKKCPCKSAAKKKTVAMKEIDDQNASRSLAPCGSSTKEKKLKKMTSEPCSPATFHPIAGNKPKPEVVVDSTPMEIMDVRRVSSDSLLIKWTAPKSKHVRGYEILIDGTLISRVLSANRTSAVLHAISFRNSLDISIYAVTADGRCQPDAKAIFQI